MRLSLFLLTFLLSLNLFSQSPCGCHTYNCGSIKYSVVRGTEVTGINLVAPAVPAASNSGTYGWGASEWSQNIDHWDRVNTSTSMGTGLTKSIDAYTSSYYGRVNEPDTYKSVMYVYATTFNYFSSTTTCWYGAKFQINITEIPSPSIIGDTTKTVCQGDSVIFIASKSIGKIDWFLGACDGAYIGSGDTIKVSAGDTTKYYARINNGGYYSDGCLEYTLNTLPVDNIYEEHNLCFGDTIVFPDGDTLQLFEDTVQVSVLTNKYGCDSTIFSTVNIPTKPSISIKYGDSVNCEGDYILLESNISDSLLWYKGNQIEQVDTGFLLEVSSSGYYRSSVTNQYSCETFSDSLFIKVNAVPPAHYDVEDTLSICKGDSVRVIFNDSLKVLWGDGDSSSSRKFFESTTLSCVLTNSSNCTTEVNNINVYVASYPTIPKISQYGNILTTADSFQLQWYLNGDSIPNSDTNKIAITESGNYSVSMSNSMGCTTFSEVFLGVLCTSTFSSFSVNNCGDYVSPSGKVIQSSSVFTDTILNSIGCDSIITIDLTILESTDTVLNVTACKEYLLPHHDLSSNDQLINSNCEDLSGFYNYFFESTNDWIVCEPSSINGPSSDNSVIGTKAFGAVSSCTETYDADQVYILESASLDLSEYNSAELTFYMWLNSESIGSSGYDGGFVRFYNGVNWEAANLQSVSPAYDGDLRTGDYSGEYAWYGEHTEWKKVTIDISSYAGQSDFGIRWYFVSDFGTNEQGMWIDDIELNVSSSNVATPWNTTGVYFDTIPNSIGCDSIIQVDLTILPESILTLDTLVCSQFDLPSGKGSINYTGVITDTFINAIGCDSIVQYNVAVDNILCRTKVYGSDGYDHGHDIIQDKNGDYVVVGEYDGAIYFMHKFNENMELINEYYSDYANIYYARSIVEVDNGYIVVGGKDDDLYYAKFNYDFQLTWEKTYSVESDHLGRSIDKLNDGNYVIAGSANSANEGLLIKINNNGDVIWSNTYEGSVWSSWFKDVTATCEGDAVAVGLDSNQVFVVRVDGESGEVVWTKRFEHGTFAESVIYTRDHKLFAVGQSIDNSTLAMSMMSLEGELLWEKDNIGIGSGWDFDVIESMDGEFVISGSDEGNAFLVKVDRNGNHYSFDEVIIDRSATEVGSQLIQDRNYDYVMVGTSNLNGNNDVFIYKDNELYDFSRATSSVQHYNVCDSMVSPSGKYVWKESGLYTDTTINILGRDSIITLCIDYSESSLTELTLSACDSFTYSSTNLDVVWTESGVYYDTLTNVGGCDSVVIIDLSILKSDTTLKEFACSYYYSPSQKLLTESGVYYDTIQNAKGCDSLITIDLTIIEVTSSLVKTDEYCGDDGTAEVFPTGGIPPYSYSWSNNDTSRLVTDLSEGTYYVNVADSNGCNYWDTVIIEEVNSDKVYLTNMAFYDKDDVSGTVFQSHYPTLPNHIEKNPVNPRNLLDPGKYVRFKIECTNRRENGQSIVSGMCKIRTDDPYLTITDSASALNNVAWGGTEWSIDEFEVLIDPSIPQGYEASVEFFVQDGNNEWRTTCVPIPVTPLAINDVYSTVDDDNNPDSNGDDDEIVESGETVEFLPLIDNVSGLDASLVRGVFENMDGWSKISIWDDTTGISGSVVNESWWNYAFNQPNVINSGDTLMSPQFDFVFDYDYDETYEFDLHVVLGGGFELFGSVDRALVQWSDFYRFNEGYPNIPECAGLSVSVSGTNESSHGSNDGTVTANPVGGEAPYSYLWNTGDTSQSLTGLGSGTYIVDVTDANGCIGQGSKKISAACGTLSLTTSSEIESYPGASDGSASVTVSGGVAPYSYSWNTGDTASTITDLLSGYYNVNVRDANGCNEYATVFVDVDGVSTDIEEGGENEIQVYPNPTTSKLYVSFKSPFNGVLMLSSILGQTVVQKEIDSSKSMIIDVSDLESGVYMLTIQTEGALLTKRIMVE